MTDLPAKHSDPMADFQTKLKERVRNDIRDLLPDDAVAALVKKAVEDEFFKPRLVKENDYNAPVEHPSWFVAAVTKAAEPVMREAVAKCVADNPAAVEKAIGDFLNGNKLTILTTEHLTSMLSSAIYNLQENLRR